MGLSFGLPAAICLVMERPVILWFKRDLRVQDHPALTHAARLGPILPVYIVEPDLWAEPDASGRHYAFICECLESLREDLAGLGLTLVVRVGDAVKRPAISGAMGATGAWRNGPVGRGCVGRRCPNRVWCGGLAVGMRGRGRATG